MTEMVDRVARAMFTHDQLNDEAKLAEWEHDWAERKKAYIELASVAIVAMREPTAAMLDAGDCMMPQIEKGQDISTGYDALKLLDELQERS